jgi:hypothetical protein
VTPAFAFAAAPAAVASGNGATKPVRRATAKRAKPPAKAEKKEARRRTA